MNDKQVNYINCEYCEREFEEEYFTIHNKIQCLEESFLK